MSSGIHKNIKKGAVALSGSLFAKKNKSRASQSPALGDARKKVTL